MLARRVYQFISQRRTPLRCAGNCFPENKEEQETE